MKNNEQSELQKTNLSGFGARVITLCDGRSGLRGGINVEIAVPDKTDATDGTEAPVIDFIASDATLDRYDETITAAGWQLGNYKKNPVFQNSHKYGDIIFTLGKSIITEIRNGALFQRVLFAVDINPMAKLAYDLYRQKFLNAVSVGFIPLEWQDGNAATPHRRKFLKQELLELSAVSIPANPNALALAVKAGAVDRSDLKDLSEFLREFASHQEPAPAVKVIVPPTIDHGVRLLELARSVRMLLRK